MGVDIFVDIFNVTQLTSSLHALNIRNQPFLIYRIQKFYLILSLFIFNVIRFCNVIIIFQYPRCLRDTLWRVTLSKSPKLPRPRSSLQTPDLLNPLQSLQLPKLIIREQRPQMLLTQLVSVALGTVAWVFKEGTHCRAYHLLVNFLIRGLICNQRSEIV